MSYHAIQVLGLRTKSPLHPSENAMFPSPMKTLYWRQSLFGCGDVVAIIIRGMGHDL